MADKDSNAVPPILIGGADGTHISLLPAQANRHGLVTGATGTGKTVTLQILAEGFSKIGVPVFCADVKGDLSGIAAAGKPHPKIDERIEAIGIEDYEQQGTPVVFWDIYGEQGHPVRATISDMGPLLLSRLMDLSDVQEAVLHLVFRVADDEGLMLLDLKDLRSMLAAVSENRKEIGKQYGAVSTSSVASIQRGLLVLEEAGADRFFGEPALELKDFMRTAVNGRGIVNILAADKLINDPRLYATALLWLLAELFEEMPEEGDPDKPKLVFFFDEAHLLFDDAPKALMDKIEQVVRLIRSKGVGVFFVTQSPLDIPDDVLGQLGNKVQHALRAYTPRDQKAVKVVAETFRANPKLDTATVITELGTGEALVSTLDHKGRPQPVEKTLVRPPESRMGPIDAAERKAIRAGSPMAGLYDKDVDRESAYEILAKREEQLVKEEGEAQRLEEEQEKRFKSARQVGGARKTSSGTGSKRRSRSDSIGTAAAKSVARSVGTTLGRELTKAIFGTTRRRTRRRSSSATTGKIVRGILGAILR